jgi:hypothetical protein
MKTRTDCLRATEIVEFNKAPERVRQIIESAGTHLASVHFIKRSTGELRKMSYRLHVRNPSVAKKPHSDNFSNRKDQDKANDQITVFSNNEVIRDENGNKIGRGDWRTIPLENVLQVTVRGKRYIFRN